MKSDDLILVGRGPSWDGTCSFRVCYFPQGMGVARDREQALGLYQQAARIIGQTGQDVELDDAVAAEIFDEAEEDRGKEHRGERKDSSVS